MVLKHMLLKGRKDQSCFFKGTRFEIKCYLQLLMFSMNNCKFPYYGMRNYVNKFDYLFLCNHFLIILHLRLCLRSGVGVLVISGIQYWNTQQFSNTYIKIMDKIIEMRLQYALTQLCCIERGYQSKLSFEVNHNKKIQGFFRFALTLLYLSNLFQSISLIFSLKMLI